MPEPGYDQVSDTLCRAAAEERAQELSAAWRAIWRGLSGDVGLWAGLHPLLEAHPNALCEQVQQQIAVCSIECTASGMGCNHFHGKWSSCHLHGCIKACHGMTSALPSAADPNAAADQHWKRDKAEDTSRRRRRLRRTFRFQRSEDAPRGGTPAAAPSPADALSSPLLTGEPGRVDPCNPSKSKSNPTCGRRTRGSTLGMAFRSLI